MERTKGEDNQNTEENLPRWRKIGGGSFRLASGKIIKTNQVFQAAAIPEAFKHMIVALDQLPEDAPLPVGSGKYEVKVASPGWYNVIDSQGKVVNEKSLRQSAAQELIESLTK